MKLKLACDRLLRVRSVLNTLFDDSNDENKLLRELDLAIAEIMRVVVHDGGRPYYGTLAGVVANDDDHESIISEIICQFAGGQSRAGIDRTRRSRVEFERES